MATVCADTHDTDIYTVAQVRAIEQAALKNLPPRTLMMRAGKAVAAAALDLLASKEKNLCVLIAVGPGNNGGDALEAALELAKHELHITVVMPVAPGPLVLDANAALNKIKNSSSTIAIFANLPDLRADVRVHTQWDLAIDGLFGIGLTRPVQDDFRTLVEYLNQLICPVLAIDVPSGLDADLGSLIGPNGVAVKATSTVTFIANKLGLHTLHGRDYAGKVLVYDLAIDRSLFNEPIAQLNHPALFTSALHPRVHASHKGQHGDLYVMGGASGMTGAVLLAARAGSMSGAGRVFASFIDNPPAYDPVHLELMCRTAQSLFPTRGAIVAGPGMGATSASSAAYDLLARVLSIELPLVLDADALNMLANEPGLQTRLLHRRAATLITPHPLEAARLLESRTEQILANRLAAALTLAKKLRAVVVLKGSGTVIADQDGHVVINSTGNPALATAGTGDVLAGLCGSLLAQQWPLWEAALAAVWIHGDAADSMVADGSGPIGITATELLPYIRKSLNQLLTA